MDFQEAAQRVDYQQATQSVEKVRCQHEEKLSFCTRAPPTLGASMIALDGPTYLSASEGSKKNVAASKNAGNCGRAGQVERR